MVIIIFFPLAFVKTTSHNCVCVCARVFCLCRRHGSQLLAVTPMRVFPLRGKLLNVREACHKQIMDNAEIQHIKIILGMQRGKQYDSVKGLRYGHLTTMTDQV